MGIGLACFIDKAGTGPSANLAMRGGLHGGWESAIVRVHSDGKVTVLAGSHSHGQGHDITFAQIAADRLGLRYRRYPPGRGRHRSHSVRQRHLGRALGVGRRHRDLSGVGPHRRQGAVDRRPGARMREPRHRPSNAAGSGCTAPIAASVSRRSPTSPITAPSCGDDGSPGLEVTEFYDPPDTNDPQAMHLAVVHRRSRHRRGRRCARFTVPTIVA